MNAQQLGRLLLYVVDQANDREDIVTTIRLVKFLYLIDLEHFRVTGETLTGLRWVFHLFGPYAFELPGMIESIGYRIGPEEFDIGQKKGIVFRTGQEAARPAWLTYVGESIIERILEVWAGVETPILLDYVYNSTEPMKNAMRGQVLDFSVVPKGTRYFDFNIEIDRKKGNNLILKLREALQEESLELVTIETGGDDAYYALASQLDEDDWPAPSPTDQSSTMNGSSGVIVGDI